MPTYEHAALLQHKDQNGNTHIDYPITKAENVDGLYETPALTGVPTAPTAASGTNTTQIATTEFVQTELTSVKKSVSDGKTTVANAITAKGVTTATDATFAVMAENIGKIESSNGVELNIFTQTTEPDVKKGIWVKTSNNYKQAIASHNIIDSGGIWDGVNTDMPGKSLGYTRAAYFNGTNYVFSLGNSNNIYTFNGSSWSLIGSTPFSIQSYVFDVCTYDGYIHLIQYYNSTKFFYKYDGTSWTALPTTGMNFGQYGNLVSYNGKLHAIYTNSYTYHYIWDGSAWSTPSTNCRDGVLVTPKVVYDGCIHSLGGQYSTTSHYKWDGSSNNTVSTLPYAFYNGAAVVYGGCIHIFGGYGNKTGHYKWNGSSWTSVSTLPYNFNSNNCDAIVHGNVVTILNGAIVNNSTLYGYYSSFTTPENTFDPYTLVVERSDTNVGVYSTVIADLLPNVKENVVSILEGAGEMPYAFDDVWFFGASSFETTPIYYGNGSSWVKFKN